MGSVCSRERTGFRYGAPGTCSARPTGPGTSTSCSFGWTGLGGRDNLGLGRNRMIGCVAITEPVFFTPDEWVAVPSDWSRNIVSGRIEDLSRGDGLRMWTECLERAAARTDVAPGWARDAFDAQRAGSRW